jgi:uncharacterized protein YggE
MKFLFPVFALCMLFALCASSMAGEINVAGEGTVKLTPDLASVSLAVVTSDKTVSASMLSNNTAANKLYDRLASFKIAKEDIQTTDFSVRADYDNNGRPLNTYTVVNEFTIIVRDLPKLSTILDTLTKDGANHLGNLQFGVSDTQAATDKARALAVVNAHRKAIDLAHLSSLFCGAPTHITETTYQRNPYADNIRCAAPGGAGGAPISGGRLSITVNVSITYQLVDYKKESVPTQTMPLFPQD